MTPAEIATALLLPAGTLAVAALVLWATAFRRPARGRPPAAPDAAAVFLFDGQDLRDATPAGHDFLNEAGLAIPTRAALLARLETDFPDIADTLRRLPRAGSVILPAGDAEIGIEVEGPLTRIMLRTAGDRPAAGPLPRPQDPAGADTLAAIARFAPDPIWRESGGAVTWANRAYRDLASRLGHPPDKPLPALFGPADDSGRRRDSVTFPDGSRAWFDLTTARQQGAEIRFATAADAAVLAEDARRTALQTFTRTFADLPIGMAVFDAGRRLVLFNPAWVELLRLPVDFLAGRPTLDATLHRLRETRMLPEPRNWRDWTEEIGTLEAEAERGTYCDLWSLPGGQNYRVTGRPHPEGAIVFLVEDLTAEMALTRRFRAELEMGQAALDTLDEAIAIFSLGGMRMMTNRAYEALLPDAAPASGDEALGEVRLPEEAARWQARTSPDEGWERLARDGGAAARRGGWSFTAGGLRVRVAPLPGGATLLGLRREESDARHSRRSVAESA